MKKADLFFNVVRLPVDFIMLVGAGLVTYLLRTRILDAFRPVLFEFNLPLLHYLYLVLFVSVLFVIAYAVSGLYAMKGRMRLGEELAKIVVASSAGIMLVIIYIFLQQTIFNSRFLVLGGWLFAIVFVFLGRLAIRGFQYYMVTRHGFGIHRLLLIGDDETSQRIANALMAQPSAGYRIVKHLPSPDIIELALAVDNDVIDEVLLANPNYPESSITQLVDFCHEHHIIFKYVPNMYQTLTRHFDMQVIDKTPVIELRRTSLDGWGRVFKRVFDITGSSAGLLVLSPFFLVIALFIKLNSKGPVFVKLQRVSRNRRFDLYKFRSMIDHAHEMNPYLRSLGNDRPEAGPLWKMKNDPRITSVGKFIRKTRIDELPQFWNVLKGDMSIVGPRPHQPDEIAQYQKHHKKLLAIKAGATGLAQVSGSSDLPFEEEVMLDTFYVENWSPWLDIKIILRTTWKMFSDPSAV